MNHEASMKSLVEASKLHRLWKKSFVGLRRSRPNKARSARQLAMRSTCSKSSKLHCLGRGDYLAFSRDACIVERQMTWQTTFLSKKGQQTTFKKPNLEAFHLRLISEVSTHKLQVLIRTLLASILTLVITKGYGARATTIAGQNALAPRLCFPYGSRDRWSKNAWSDYQWWKVQTSCAFYSFLVEVQTKLATYMRRMRNSNLELRITGSSCRPQRFLSIVFVFILLVQAARQK